MVAFACGVLLSDPLAAARGAVHTIVIEGSSYTPAALSVRKGDTIVWVNKDPFPHTVTAPGAFDSHSIAANRSWRYAARVPGEYGYTCTLHPNMKGNLKIE